MVLMGSVVLVEKIEPNLNSALGEVEKMVANKMKCVLQTNADLNCILIFIPLIVLQAF